MTTKAKLADEAALRRTLTDLVAVDTTSARPNAPFVDAAEARLKAAGFDTQRQVYRDAGGVEKVNLVAVKGPREDRAALALVGHTDCVPFDPKWAEALTLTLRDGRLYGRGACDTKGFIACALEAAERAEGLRRSLMVVLTADEEVGCVGAKKLVEASLGRARHAIVGEPTELTPVRAHKGYCIAEVEVLGKEGHSAYPETGASAVFRAARFLARFEQRAREVLEPEQDAAFHPPFTTVNVGLISGGKAKNILPGLCTFTVEWRPIPRQPVERVPELLQGILAELQREEPAYEARIRVLRTDRGVDTREDAEVVRFLAQASGRAAKTVPFGTEAPQLTQLGAEAVVFGPGDIRNAHQTGEYVPVGDLEACHRHLAAAIAHFCG